MNPSDHIHVSTTSHAEAPSRRWLAPVAVAAALATGLMATGCAVREQVVVRESVPHAQIRPMPGPIAEDRGAQPGPGWAWLPGHWKWQGRDWAWSHGHWVQQSVPPMPAVIVEQITVAPSSLHFWVPGHWVWRLDAGGWVWVKGGWHA